MRLKDYNERDGTIKCGRCAGTGELLNGEECTNCGGDGYHNVITICD